MVAACNDECRRLLTCLQATRQCRSLLITYMRFWPSAHDGESVNAESGLSLILKLGKESWKEMDILVYVQADGRSEERGLRAGGESYEVFQGVPKDDGCPRLGYRYGTYT